MFVDEQGNVWACGGNKNGELGLGHANLTYSPQKNNILSGIAAVAGGNANYTVFLDNAGNIYTIFTLSVWSCGTNEFGQLGLGDTVDRNTPQKLNYIPPIARLSSCHVAEGYLQLVDVEGRVWGCGNNQFGQLGFGNSYPKYTFQRIETIAKLEQNPIEQPDTNNQVLQQNAVPEVDLPNTTNQAEGQKEGFGEEKEMFKAMEKEQNKQLMDKVKSLHWHNVNKQQAKQKIIEGVIGMADWSSKWEGIHANKQQRNQLREQHKANLKIKHQAVEQRKINLKKKQKELDKLTKEVINIKQALATFEEQKEVVDFFDILLEPVAEAEKELKSGFEEKLHAGKHGEWTMDEVSLFLNVCGMENVVTHQREMQIGGDVLEDAIVDVTVMGIKDPLAEKKMEFYLKVLESGKMMNEEQLSQSVVWRHREVGKTLLLLREWEIALDEETRE